jgi:chromosome segregation ATPase
MEAETAPPSPWLEELERRVQQAVAEIARLRQDNRRLERELAKLRKRQDEEGAGAWQREREQVRGRVERLAARLEELLGPDAEAPAAGELPFPD